MSTKIYNGIRFPKTKLATFISDAKKKGLDYVYNYAKNACLLWELESPYLLNLSKQHPNLSEWGLLVQTTMNTVSEAQKSLEREPFLDLNCGWGIWIPETGRYALACPWGEEHLLADIPDCATSYAYWNNTDRPDDVSSQEWTRRRKAWQIACEPFPHNRQLELPIFKLEAGRSPGVDFFWLHRKLLEENLSGREIEAVRAKRREEMARNSKEG